MNKNFHEIGLAFLDQNQYTLAKKFFNLCIEEEPDNALAYLHRGIVSFRLWDKIQAVDDLTMSIKLSETKDAYLNRAIVRIESHEFDLAYLDLKHVLELDSDSLEALINITPILIAKKNYKEAYEFHVRTTKLMEMTDELQLEEIHINYGLKKYNDCLQGLFSLLRKSPYNSDHLNYVGYCYLMLNDQNEAIKYFEKALQYNPDLPFPINNLGYIEYLNSNLDKAKKLIYKSLEIDPSNCYAYKNLGLIEIQLGNIKNAIEHFEFSLLLGFRELWGEEVDELLNSIRHNS